MRQTLFRLKPRRIAILILAAFLSAAAAPSAQPQQPATPQPAQDTTKSSQQAQPRQEIPISPEDTKEWSRIQDEFARNEQDYQLRRKAILKDFEAFLWRVKAQNNCPACGFDEAKRVLVRPEAAVAPAK